MKKEMIFPSNITEFRRNEKKRKRKTCCWPKFGGLARGVPPPENFRLKKNVKENRKEKKGENLWQAGAWRVSRGVATAGSVGGADDSGEGRKER